MTKDDAGHVFIAQLVVLEFLGTEQSVAQPSTGGDGHGGEEDLAGNVPDDVDALDVAVLVLVSDDISLLVELDVVEVLQPELFRIGVPTDGPEQDVDLDGFVGRVGVDFQPGAGLFHTLDVGLLVNVDARLFHVIAKDVLQHRVKRPQHLVVTDHQVSLGPERMEHAGQLDGNVPGTDDGDPFGLFLDLKEPVRVDPVGRTRNVIVRGDRGTSTDGDDDLFGLDGVRRPVILGNLDLILGDERRPSLVIGYLVVDEVLFAKQGSKQSIRSVSTSSGSSHDDLDLDLLDPVETLDVGVPLVLQIVPLELGDGDLGGFVTESIVRRLAEVIGDVGRVPHDLFRNAS